MTTLSGQKSFNINFSPIFLLFENYRDRGRQTLADSNNKKKTDLFCHLSNQIILCSKIYFSYEY